MTEPHAVLNTMSPDDASAALLRCCGSTRWVERMLARRPFVSTPALRQAADDIWFGLQESDYLEAFAHHPQIGKDLAKLPQKFVDPSLVRGGTAPLDSASWSSQEQASVHAASEPTLVALRDGNVLYLARYGYIFIVCATGKSADEMLALLRARLDNSVEDELAIAAREHAKITRLRLDKLTT